MIFALLHGTIGLTGITLARPVQEVVTYKAPNLTCSKRQAGLFLMQTDYIRNNATSNICSLRYEYPQHSFDCEILVKSLLLSCGCGNKGAGTIKNTTPYLSLRRLKAKGYLDIGVFGGSISRGHGSKKSYGSYLVELLTQVLEPFKVRVRVYNYAVPASGPVLVQRLILCGLKPFDNVDMVISEFSINEQSTEVFQKWYEFLMIASDVPVIVLNLFSFRIPPNGTRDHKYAPAVTMVPKNLSNIDKISIVDFRAPGMELWPNTFPYTKSGMFPGGGSHGNTLYHELIALSLGYGIHQLFSTQERPSLAHPRKQPAPSPAVGNHKQTKAKLECYGTWGIKVAKLPKSARGIVKSLTELFPDIGPGWHIGTPFAHDPSKISLYVNTTGVGDAVFRVPDETISVTVWYVGHTSDEEVSSFEIQENNLNSVHNFSTKLHGESNLRIASFVTIQLLNGTVATARSMKIKPTYFATPQSTLEIIRVEFERR